MTTKNLDRLFVRLLIGVLCCLLVPVQSDEEAISRSSNALALRKTFEYGNERTQQTTLPSTTANDNFTGETVRPTTNQPVVKRRKLRKRKRRPNKTSTTPGPPENLSDYGSRKQHSKKRPQNLAENEWDVMMDYASTFNHQRPYNSRRKMIPDYTPTELPTLQTATGDEFHVRDKSKQIDKEDLKSVLKKSEGTLSLSEILQQNNLTLTDLLKGGGKVINAIIGQQPETTTAATIATNADAKSDLMMQSSKSNMRFKNKLPITSANLLKYTTYKTKPDQSKKKDRVQAEKAEIPPEAIAINLNDLFGFSELFPEKNANSTDDKKIEQIFTTNKTENRKEYGERKGPLKMVIDLEKIGRSSNRNTVEKPNFEMNQSINKNQDIKQFTPDETKREESTSATTLLQQTAINPSRLQDKLKIKSAKEEILEFLNDKANERNISKILKSRNMTLQELVQLRERGSSQKHLLDIFQNKSSELNNVIHGLLNEEDKSKHTTNDFFQYATVIMHTGRKPKSHESQESYTTNLEGKSTESTKIETVDQKKTKFDMSVTSFPLYKIGPSKKNADDRQEQDSMPFWKSIYQPAITNNHLDLGSPDSDLGAEETNTNPVLRGEAQDSTGNSISNDQLNVESFEDVTSLDDNGDSSIFHFDWPTGIKSALLASLAIIAASIFIFLGILFLFRYTQRTKRKLCYSGCVVNAPILEEKASKRATIRTMVCETLGRKKNVYWKSKQSMSDGNTWGDNRIPFQ